MTACVAAAVLAIAPTASSAAVLSVGGPQPHYPQFKTPLPNDYLWTMTYVGGAENNAPAFSVGNFIGSVSDPGIAITADPLLGGCLGFTGNGLCTSLLTGALQAQLQHTAPNRVLINVAPGPGNDRVAPPASLNADVEVFDGAGDDVYDLSQSQRSWYHATYIDHPPILPNSPPPDNDGADRIIGNASTTVGYQGRFTPGVAPVSITLDGIANDGGPGEGDNVTGAGTIVGSDLADTLVGDDQPNTIDNYFGNDTIDGRGGNDTILLHFAPGANVTCGPGDDTVRMDHSAGATIAADCEHVISS